MGCFKAYSGGREREELKVIYGFTSNYKLLLRPVNDGEWKTIMSDINDALGKDMTATEEGIVNYIQDTFTTISNSAKNMFSNTEDAKAKRQEAMLTGTMYGTTPMTMST